MSEEIQRPARLRFGVFELNVSAEELRKHGIRVRLHGQPLQLLALLLERRGEIVTREEMRERLWPAGTFVDFENSLNAAVKRLRAALGDSAENARYIETVAGKGYRFIAPVEKQTIPVVPASSAAEEMSLASPPAGALPAIGRPLLRRLPVLLWIAATLLVALGGYFQWSRSRARPVPLSGKLMLAVLPFENLTGDAGQDYFGDGLTEEIISQLGRLDPPRLGVVARTSVMHYKHNPEPLGQIGRELGVQYVLEGSVRRDADKVRISAQLIRVADQTHLWSRQYDRQLSNLLALQSEITEEIADEIELTFGDAPEKKAVRRHTVASPTSYEAYDLYLKGRYFWNKRTRQGFQQAADYFQQATDKDPNYARAYAGLADNWALMGNWYEAPQNEAMSKARAAALKALQIDEGLAEAHTSLALIAESYDHDWLTAEKEYQRAIQLDPSYATAHQWYAECLSFEGRFEEALAESERARQLDPLSLIIAADHGVILYVSRQFDPAIEQFRAVLDMEPTFSRAYTIIPAYVQQGRFADALAYTEKWRRLPGPTPPIIWALQVYVYGRWGRREQAQQALKKLQQAIRGVPWQPNLRMLVYLGMDRKDEAIALLQKAYSEHSNAVMALKVGPIYDPLRSDPRFQELRRRVGL